MFCCFYCVCLHVFCLVVTFFHSLVLFVKSQVQNSSPKQRKLKVVAATCFARYNSFFVDHLIVFVLKTKGSLFAFFAAGVEKCKFVSELFSSFVE